MKKMRAICNGKIVDVEIHADELEGYALIKGGDKATIQVWAQEQYANDPLYFIALPDLSYEKILHIVRCFDQWYGDTNQETSEYAVEFQLLVRMLINTNGGVPYLLINPHHLLLEDDELDILTRIINL